MSALYKNAIAALRMGVEDYAQQDWERSLSAVRNFYAGVLLLAKEALVRAAPEADIAEIIGAKYKPVPDGDGGVVYQQEGNTTIDFHTLGARFKDFGLAIDHKALSDLNRIRNEIEHRYTDQPQEALREAIAKAFPVTAELFRQIEEDPVEAMGSAWQTMLETTHLYEKELEQCRRSLAEIEWHSGTVAKEGVKCTACGSSLVEQIDSDNKHQEIAELKCRACGEALEIQEVVVAALEEGLAGEAYVRMKDAGEDGPIHMCPECQADAYIDFESKCAACGHEIEPVECGRCGTSLSLDELIYGEGSSLCSYCDHMTAKAMRE